MPIRNIDPSRDLSASAGVGRQWRGQWRSRRRRGGCGVEEGWYNDIGDDGDKVGGGAEAE
ncbi:hypothetical protein DFQ26_007550, partial [Actinomortierella ambigua]